MYFKRFIIVLVFLITSLGATSQEENSLFVDSTGRLFIRPGTPVFLHMGTTPDGADAVRLLPIDGVESPISFNGHGPQQLTHMDLYLGRNIRFNLFVDGLPPKTTTSFSAQKGFQRENKIYISGTAIVELQGFDLSSGVSAVFYSINESEFIPYTKPLIFEKEGESRLLFYAIDNVGNKEDEGERIIVVDSTPPVSTLKIEGPQHNEVVAAQSKFILESTDSIGIKETLYSINNGEFSKYLRPITISNLPEGEHAISWYSVDLVGNIEHELNFKFFVDRTPPMVFEEIMGNTYMVAGREFSSGRSQLRIVAVDNKAGIRDIHYSINKEPFKLYEKPIFLSDITGAVVVRSYAIDNVENKGTSDAEGMQFSMPVVDITGPDINHTFTGPKLVLRDTLWISPLTSINISANDKGAGLHRIEYRVNNEEPKPYEGSFTVANPNYHKIVCTAWDNVENLNISNFDFGVDTKAPDIILNFSVKPYNHVTEQNELIPVFTPGTQIFIGATDDIVGVERIMVAINDSREKVYTQPLSGFKANQAHIITIRAIDKLGNEVVKTARFRID